jgi:UV DNA damage repair endonuclease
MSNFYDKMDIYIKSVCNVFCLVNDKADKQQDKRLKMIALTIYNYIRYMAKEYNIDLKNVNETENINLIPIFEYIKANNIELYNFSNIKMDDLDVTKKEDLERFILSHIYYITQGM